LSYKPIVTNSYSTLHYNRLSIDMQPNEYQLNDIDRVRIAPLLNQIQKNTLHLKYMVTLEYWYPMKKYDKVIVHARDDRKLVRQYFKSDVRFIGFAEKHTNINTPNYMGYHRHELFEDIPTERWLNPTKRMENWMLEYDPSMLFGIRYGTEPTTDQKMALMRRVLQKLQPKQVAQGKLGIDIREIYNLQGVLAYCSKQFEHYHPSYEVIMPSSDICLRHFIEKKQLGEQYVARNPSY